MASDGCRPRPRGVVTVHKKCAYRACAVCLRAAACSCSRAGPAAERELNTIIFMNTELNTGVIKVFKLEYPGYTSIRARILVPAQTPLFMNTIPTISHMNTLLPWLLSS